MLGSGDSSHIIKLRGLPFSTTVEDVLDFLSGVNVVGGKEGVHLTEVRPGRPSGECFVEVESQQDVDEALKKDKENMGKRYIEVFSTDRQDMEWALNSSRSQGDNGFGGMANMSDEMGIVKLRGLPFGCSKEEIVQFFGGLPVAPDGVHILSDHSGRASGEAFVHFTNKESAHQALQRDREKIGHRYIEVFISSSDEVRSYSARMEDGFRSSRGYRPTPYDRGDRFNAGGRFGGRGGRGGGYGHDGMSLPS
ncbi:RNA recognition motif domain-containing protein [Phthorimaea operculella]|nr:RNA recognition motif domain-containing protein [Phthorimaea operculella]